MIFHCPRCQAGHSVAVSTVPVDGLPIECRRCAHSFRVDIPPEMADLTVETEDPATAAGVATPFSDVAVAKLEVSAGDDAWTAGGSLLGSATTTPPPEDGPEMTSVGFAPDVTDLALAPEVTSLDPPLQTVVGAQSSHQSTAPFSPDPLPNVALDESPTGPSPGRDASRPPPLPKRSEAEPSSSQMPAIWSPNELPSGEDTRERRDTRDTERAQAPQARPVIDEDALYGPLARRQYAAPAERVAPGAWPDSSELSGAINLGPARWLRTQAERFDKGSLMLKLAILIGPLIVGIAILFIGFNRPRSRAPAAAASFVASVEAPATRIEEPPPEPPAPPEISFVQVDRLRLRASARRRAPTVARLAAGRQVHVLRHRRSWRLVIVEPNGPVGFVKGSALGPDRPLLALARDRAFKGCRTTRRFRTKDCLYKARSSQAACELQCAVDDSLPPDRCQAACQLAFDRCAVRCRRRR